MPISLLSQHPVRAALALQAEPFYHEERMALDMLAMFDQYPNVDLGTLIQPPLSYG